MILRQQVREGDFSGYKLGENTGYENNAATETDSVFDNGARTRHWNSMVDSCHICKIEWFFIGKLETFEDDFELLLDALGLSGAFSFPKELKRNSVDVERRMARFKFYFGKLPRETITRLYHAYEHDFIAFGYEVPGFLR